MDSNIFFSAPVVDESGRGAGATVPFLKVVFAFAVCSGSVTAATLLVRPVTLWLTLFVSILGLMAVRRSALGRDRRYQRNV